MQQRDLAKYDKVDTGKSTWNGGRREKLKLIWIFQHFYQFCLVWNIFWRISVPSIPWLFLTEEPVMGTFVSCFHDVTTRRVPILEPIHLQFSYPSTPHYAYFRTTCHSPLPKKPPHDPSSNWAARSCCGWNLSFLLKKTRFHMVAPFPSWVTLLLVHCCTPSLCWLDAEKINTKSLWSIQRSSSWPTNCTTSNAF